jgi:ribosomal protein S27AE
MKTSLPSDQLACPWCKTDSITTQIRERVLRLKCNKCGMDAFVTKIPKQKRISDSKRKIPIS